MSTVTWLIDLRDKAADQYWDQIEHNEATRRLQQYRRENLFWRLGGLPIEVAEQISEAVWEVPTPYMTRCSHRNPFPVVGFKG